MSNYPVKKFLKMDLQKKVSSGVFLFLFGAGLFAQGLNHGMTKKEYFIDKVEKAPAARISRFKIDKKSNVVYFQVHRHTLEFKQKNLDDILSHSLAAVKKVYFVSARCNDGTATAQEITDRNIIGVLYDKLPDIANRENIEYARIVQTGCQFDYQGADLLHGFILEIDPAMMARRGSEIAFIETYFTAHEDELTKLLNKETGDASVVNKVFERNPQWAEALVVTDVTGSMMPYVGQLVVWHRLNLLKSQIKFFEFFNDGDATPDHKKITGSTGGIYPVSTNKIDELRSTLTRAIAGGSGGDGPENDFEALIRGLKDCPTCKDIVLIADNNSPVRDFELLKNIDRPVRVILCGTSSGYINLEYLELARVTGGSVHTMEKDIENLMKMQEGQTITFGSQTYVIKEGKFIRQEPEPKPKPSPEAK